MGDPSRVRITGPLYSSSSTSRASSAARCRRRCREWPPGSPAFREHWSPDRSTNSWRAATGIPRVLADVAGHGSAKLAITSLRSVVLPVANPPQFGSKAGRVRRTSS